MSGKTDNAVKAKTAYHHGDLRAQLIEAARALVESHGADGFSVSQAARLAGVSSAAPYKHFKDKPALLRAMVGEGMDRLREAMARGAARYAPGSLESVSAVGLAYIDFAKAEPGVFRLMFGQTEGHDEDETLMMKGQTCFSIVVKAAADCLGIAADAEEAQERAYILWTFVHGHSFLTIDNKRKVDARRPADWSYLMAVAEGILGPRRGALPDPDRADEAAPGSAGREA